MKTRVWVILLAMFIFSCSLAACSTGLDGAPSEGPIVHENDSAVFADNGRGPRLTVTDFDWRYLGHVQQIYVTGNVRNDNGKDIQGCRMLITAFDQYNNPLGTAEAYLQPTYIGAGQTSSFDFYLPRGQWVTALHLQYRFEIRYQRWLVGAVNCPLKQNGFEWDYSLPISCG